MNIDIKWEYEDMLKVKKLTTAMYVLSKVDFVRMYPYVVHKGYRIYLGSSELIENIKEDKS